MKSNAVKLLREKYKWNVKDPDKLKQLHAERNKVLKKKIEFAMQPVLDYADNAFEDIVEEWDVAKLIIERESKPIHVPQLRTYIYLPIGKVIKWEPALPRYNTVLLAMLKVFSEKQVYQAYSKMKEQLCLN